MRYEHVELHNFGPHRRLALDPSPRMTGIVGPNGSGKSTVLAALEYAVTGAIPLEGEKALNVCQRAGPKERSAVEAAIRHGTHRLEIVRDVRKPGRDQVRVDGGPAVTGASGVNAELAAVFGASSGLFAEYVFVKQGHIAEFLSRTPAVRAAGYARLFGTDVAARRYDLVTRRLARIAVPPAADVDAARRALGEARSRLAEARAERRLYRDLKGYRREDDPDARVVDRRASWRKAKAERAEAEAERSASAGHAARYAEAAAAAQAEADRLAAEHEAARVDADAAKVALATWDLRAAHEERIAALAAREVAIRRDKEAHPRPKAPEGYAPSGDLADLGLAAWGACEQAREFVESFADDVAACPTCGTATAALADRLAEARAALPALEAEVARLSAAKKAADAYEKALVSWESWRGGHKKRVEEYNRDLAAATAAAPPEPPGRDRAALKAVVDRADALARAAQQKAQTARGAAASAARCRGEADAAARRVARLRREVKSLRVPRAEYAAARARLKATEARRAARHRASGLVAAAEAEAARRGEELAAAEAAAAAADRARRAVDRLEAVRDVLHRDALPRLVHADYLGAMREGINAALRDAALGFQVREAEDLAYEADFGDGVAQPAARLSAGQRVMLAVAFRTEVNVTFASGIGALCLDEPTAYLDDSNLLHMEAALARLGQLSEASGLQCIVVTHERRLGRLFDAVVDTGPAP